MFGLSIATSAAPVFGPLAAVGGLFMGLAHIVTDRGSFVSPPKTACQRVCGQELGRIDLLLLEYWGIWLDDASSGKSEFWTEGESYSKFQLQCNNYYHHAHVVGGCQSVPVAFGRGSSGRWSSVRNLTRLLTDEKDPRVVRKTLRELGCQMSYFSSKIMAGRFPSLYRTERTANEERYIPLYPEIEHPQC